MVTRTHLKVTLYVHWLSRLFSIRDRQLVNFYSLEKKNKQDIATAHGTSQLRLPSLSQAPRTETHPLTF
jgi:hypothetical protein